MSEVKILSPRLPLIRQPSLPLPFAYRPSVTTTSVSAMDDFASSGQPVIVGGATLTSGDRLLLHDDPDDPNGVYVFTAGAGPTPHSWVLSAADEVNRAVVVVTSGTHVNESWVRLSAGLWVPYLSFIANERLYLPENRSERRVT